MKTIFKWLDKYKIPYDEIRVGKPWCGFNGFYVDDQTIRPDEFVNLSLKEIKKIINSTNIGELADLTKKVLKATSGAEINMLLQQYHAAPV